MRLTLRTLLAYLDDVLGPEQTREIGTKVDESNVAKTLMARLKEVMRKRRVLAPAIDTRDANADANSISQYLDNTLPPERIADVERKALESDEVLAEVASCHQILTLVLGNPAHITEQTRSKMYSLVDSKLTKPASPPPVVSPSAVAATAAPRPPASELEAIGAGSGFYRMAEMLGEPIESKTTEVPQYLKKSETSGNLLKVLAVVAVLLVWVGLVYSDPALNWFRGKTTEVADNEATEVIELAPGEQLPGFAPTFDPAGSMTDPRSKPKTSTEVAMVTPKSTTSSPLTSTNVAMTNVISKPMDSTSVAMASTSPSVPAPTPTATSKPDSRVPAETSRPASKYTFTSPDELLLGEVWVDGNPQWKVMETGGILQEGQRVAVPKPFRAELIGPNPLLGVTVDGASLLTLDGSDEKSAMELKLTQGRLIFTHKGQTDAESSDPALRVGVEMQKDSWTLELVEPGTICGLEMVPRTPVTYEEDFRGVGYFARVILKKGKVYQGGKPVSIIENGDSVIKTWEGAGNPTLTQVVGNLMGLVSDGSWMDESLDRRTPTQRSYLVKYYRVFSPGMNVMQILPVTATDSDVRMSEYATLTLGLIRNTRELVSILASGGISQESREDAIQSLRMWMNEDITNRVELKEELADYFSEGTADIVYRLLWGVSKQEAASPITSRQLIDLLSHQDVAVRHLTIDQLRDLTGRDYEYRAEAPKQLRDKSVARWIEHLVKEGAVLPAAKEELPIPIPATTPSATPAATPPTTEPAVTPSESAPAGK